MGSTSRRLRWATNFRASWGCRSKSGSSELKRSGGATPHLPLILEFPLAAGDALPRIQQVLHTTAHPLAQLLLFLPSQLSVVPFGPPGNGIEDEVQLVAMLCNGGCPRGCRQLAVSQAASATVIAAIPRSMARGEKGVTLVASTAR